MHKHTAQTVEKLKISMSRKGLGNEACPKWNPQAEFISAEEKPRFQGFAEQILHEEIGLYSSVLTRQNPIGALPPASGFAAMDFDEGCRLCRHPQRCGKFRTSFLLNEQAAVCGGCL